MNLIDFFDNAAAAAPRRAAYIVDGEAWSYERVSDLATRIGHGLAALGVTRETKCAVLSRNDPLAFTVLLGILKARGAWVPLNVGGAEDEHTHILRWFDVEVLFYQKEFEPYARRVHSSIDRVRHFICIDGHSDFAADLTAWMRDQDDTPIDLPWDPDGLCMLRGTGGTTGRPKGVMNTNRNFEANLANYRALLRFDGPPVYLAAAPLSHAATVFGFVNIAFGGTMVILTRFDAQAVLRAIEQYRVSFVYLPPTAIYTLLSQPNIGSFSFKSLKHFIYGAAPMSAAKLAEAINAFGPVMTQAYGQTEAPAGVALLAPEDHFDSSGALDERRLLACGKPMPFTRVALMDDAGRFVKPGDIGEIVVQGAIVMRGYYKDPSATEEVSTFGWHHTGDLAYRDEEGYIYICDRKKEMIITGGFNVFPFEIEQVILSHEAVQDCAVVGVPDEKWGESVKAVVELKRGHFVSEADLIALCKQRLGSVKAPKSVDYSDSLPRSPVGKVMRRAVRDRYWAGKSRQV
jgi:acyl-CoA synthetase (AMP-forming)/AMP-acid ligase II